jgi:hypothetical protein
MAFHPKEDLSLFYSGANPFDRQAQITLGIVREIIHPDSRVKNLLISSRLLRQQSLRRWRDRDINLIYRSQ